MTPESMMIFIFGANHLLYPMSRFSEVKVGVFWFVGEVGEIFLPRLGRLGGLYLRAFVPLVKRGHRDDLGGGAQGCPPSQTIVAAAPAVSRILPVPWSNSSILK